MKGWHWYVIGGLVVLYLWQRWTAAPARVETSTPVGKHA